MDNEIQATATMDNAVQAAIEVVLVHFSRLVLHPRNARRRVSQHRVEEIAASIQEHGVVQPLVGVPLPDGRIMVICGHVRTLSVRHLVKTGQITVEHPRAYLPVRLEPDMPPERQLALMIVENVHRVPLSPLDEGLHYEALAEQGWTKARMSRKMSVSEPRINNRLALAQLEPSVQDLILDGQLPLLSAEPLLAITGVADRVNLAHLMAGQGLSLPRIRLMCQAVAERGLDALSAEGNRGAGRIEGTGQAAAAAGGNGTGSPSTAEGQSAPQRVQKAQVPGNGSPRRMAPRVGLAALRAGALDVCRRCKAACRLELPKEMTFEQVEEAQMVVCGKCEVRAVINACQACPLNEFLGELARLAPDEVNLI
jgi:ParB/RepB/Spo0J family partition protein